ncbi:MAG TPA: prepilin-type N-terminal cleavage/methylation domain-containing protein [Usitatibacter sp.]|nr:prepilin-type N-terminal cleavage/methylation domain-containing protein [Usitatibacter sp.]
MKSQQSGFTLVEIAIVLVIIGLLLGGILKGQELINSAKVKNLANDFRTIPTYIYAYQDKFKSLPGDDSQVVLHVGATASPGTGGTLGNGVVEGLWNDPETGTTEANIFWQHVRLANLAAGPTVPAVGFAPVNAVGGRIGVSSMSAAQIEIDNPTTTPANPMRGTYQICSAGVLGKFVKQLDIQMDDGNTATGSMRAHLTGAALGSASTATAAVDDALSYTVCMAF